jgi:hypothetical protein
MIREGRIRFDRAKEILRHLLRGVRGKVQRIETHLRHSEGKSVGDAEDPAGEQDAAGREEEERE